MWYITAYPRLTSRPDVRSAGDNRCGGAEARSAEDRLRFHGRHGSLVLLTAQDRTAERRRPLDEFNNGVVLTHRPLRDDELFEVGRSGMASSSR